MPRTNRFSPPPPSGKGFRGHGTYRISRTTFPNTLSPSADTPAFLEESVLNHHVCKEVNVQYSNNIVSRCDGQFQSNLLSHFVTVSGYSCKKVYPEDG